MPAAAAALRWSWLLGVALIAPAALPAGGAERRQPEVRRRDAGGPFLSGSDVLLQGSPLVEAPALRHLEIGTPLQLLRRWRCADGHEWLQVQVASGSALPSDPQPRRGWIHG
ncbi:hypothetical protein CWE17_04715 [Synechococcus sp. BS56D]|jgi:hypothetical protein|uniref:SH3 domain-containing protein n=1 Tax=Synechococcus sp. BS56D TaxID=2055944 RepID=UPI001039F5B5|nr:SH3 domain-containing protein [Synechococcus sp. BS56D]TCD59144.1 hypothetical protein CWE17_04715 [Synechococcus sp. BS56D]